MQAGINLEVLRKGANSTISVVRMAFYPLISFLRLYNLIVGMLVIKKRINYTKY